jgi:SPP1 family predicted phage head-tail adaptor
VYGSIDFTEAFSGNARWASIHTKNGKIIMDDVGRDQNVTHEVYIRHDATVNSETYIQTEDGRRFKILTVENYDERKEFMRLNCTDRGLNEAAKA